MEIKAFLEAKNEAEHLIRASHKFLKQNNELLSNVEKQKIVELSKNLQNSIDTKDKNLINQAMEYLNEFTTPLAEKFLDVHISKALLGKEI